MFRCDGSVRCWIPPGELPFLHSANESSLFCGANQRTSSKMMKSMRSHLTCATFSLPLLTEWEDPAGKNESSIRPTSPVFNTQRCCPLSTVPWWKNPNVPYVTESDVRQYFVRSSWVAQAVVRRKAMGTIIKKHTLVKNAIFHTKKSV